MARHTDPGPRSNERLWLNSKGEITTKKGGVLVAAEGAPIAPEFHDQVNEYLTGKEAEGGTGDERKPAAAREAAVRAEKAEGRAEVAKAEPSMGTVTTIPKPASTVRTVSGPAPKAEVKKGK
jgi:hypothetical protein